MTTLVLAFVAGVLTLVNPCVLPLLPLVLGGSTASDRVGPLMLAAGLVISFTLVGSIVAAFGHVIGLDPGASRVAAAIILVLAGFVLANRQAEEGFARLAQPVSSAGNALIAGLPFSGSAGQFLLGALLGLIWTPCVGPTLGAAIALASQGTRIGEVVVTMAVFSLGAASVIMLAAYALRGLLRRRRENVALASRRMRTLFGYLMIAVGVLVLSGFDKLLETALTKAMPDWLLKLTTSV